MEFRKRLHLKIEEMKSGSYGNGYGSSDQIPFDDVIWKIFEDSRKKVMQLSNIPLNAHNVESYVSEWNDSAWSLLDVTVNMSVVANIVPSAAWQRDDYKIRRTIQELLIITSNCSPVLRLSDDTYIPAQCRTMAQQYKCVKAHLDQLNSLANSGRIVAEDQMRELLRQYHISVSAFTNQFVPQLLHAEAVKVRCLEKQYHPITQTKQVFKLPDQQKEFQTLSNWAFSLVASLLSRSIEIVNQIFLFPQTTQYASLMATELSSIAPNAVVGLCKFLLWVSSHPPMILVTRTEFACHCLLLNNYFVSSDTVKVQVVSESTARNIQDQCFFKGLELGRTTDTTFPSAGILVRKDPLTIQPSSKRKKRSTADGESAASASFKQKSSLSSLVLTNSVEIPFTENAVYRIPVAEADSMLCTDRFMSDQDGGSNEKLRDIYYLHFWTSVSIFNISYTVHTLSLPFVIPTRKNQDLQLHRMLKSYSATIFWLHVAGQQDGFLFTWKDQMNWMDFSTAFNIYFTREARTTDRGLSEFDFILLREKMKCNDCGSDLMTRPDVLSFQNTICPHLFYQVGDKSVNKHSVWRALLDLIQLFQNDRTKVKELWDKRFINGLWSMDSVTKILGRYSQPVLMARISLLLSGSIVLSFISKTNRIVHTEPLDQQHLCKRNLADCISDLVQSENIIYILDDQLQPHPAKGFLIDTFGFQTHIQMKANSDQLGCPTNHKNYTFNAVKLALVACGSGEKVTDVNVNGSTSFQQGQIETSFSEEIQNLLQRYNCTKQNAITMLQNLSLGENDFRKSRMLQLQDDEDQSASDNSSF